MTSNVCTGYRFDSFEVQLEAHTLLHKGFSVRIQQLPFQTLVVLLEQAGKTVSRDELKQRLWSDSTFLEFDNNLRVAVTKLREALGEQASDPRFIRTVARKGYQFIGDVTPVFATAGDAISIFAAPVADVASQATLQTQDGGDRPAPLIQPSVHRLQLRAAGLILAILSIAGGAMLAVRWYQRPPLASDKDKVALGGVLNESGDAAFDGVLTTAFRLKLQESPYLSAIPEQDFLQLAGQSDDAASLSGQVSACKTLGASFLLNGRLLGRKPGYQVQVDVLRCSDGRKMTSEEATASTQSDVLPALDQAVQRVRRRMGESDTSLERFNAPLTHATTSSLAALKAFMSGHQKNTQGQFVESVSDYKLATDLDPQFAMAYAYLGTAYLNTGQDTEASNAYQMAFKLRERATDRERLYIAAHYYQTVTGEMHRAIEVYLLWQSIYPRDIIPVESLVQVYLSLGTVEKALPLAKLAIELDPISPGAYALAAGAYLGNADYKELNKLCSDPLRNRTDVALFHSSCYLSAFVQHDEAGVARELSWVRGNPQEGALLEYVAWTEMSQGKLAQARQTFAHARQLAMKHDMTDFAAQLDLDEAGLDADMGEENEARKHTLGALKTAPASRSVQAFAALTLAQIGEVDLAQSEAAKAVAQAPLDAVQRDTYLALVRASLQLRQHNVRTAIESMEDVRPFDNIGYMVLAPAYYRGLALIDDHQYGAATHEFQRVIDHRALYPQSAYIVLSELQLGRALQLSGRSKEAQAQYDIVKNTWRQADRDFPPLAELKKWSHSAELESGDTRR